MARLRIVKAARKKQGKCRKCGVEIGIGDGYRWQKPFRSWKRRWCMKPECTPKPWELITGRYASEVCRIQSEAGDSVVGCWSVESLESLRDDLAMQASQLGDEAQEGLDAWESGNQQLEERVDALHGWSETIEAVEFEEFEPDEDVDDEEELDALREQHWEEQQELLNEALEECDLL